MSEPKNYASLLSSYHHIRTAGGDKREQTPERKRQIAVTVALSLLDSHAIGGGAERHPSMYKTEIAPLADAIQAALDQEQ